MKKAEFGFQLFYFQDFQMFICVHFLLSSFPRQQVHFGTMTRVGIKPGSTHQSLLEFERSATTADFTLH